MVIMTSKIDEIIKQVRTFPPERQDEIADVLRAMSTEVATTPEILAAIDEGMADAEAGRFAEPEAVATLFARFRHT